VTARQQLQGLFDLYRRSYFAGRLPRYKVSLATRHVTGPGHRGECLTATRTLFISPGIDSEAQRRTLLHEMCHIGCPSHGARFQARLRTLAEKHGEGWAAVEAAQYGSPAASVRITNRYVRGAITDLACESPTLSWPRARRILAADVLTRPLDFEKRYPWARAAWLREAREEKAAAARLHLSRMQ
jgi:hypothetical protein